MNALIQRKKREFRVPMFVYSSLNLSAEIFRIGPHIYTIYLYHMVSGSNEIDRKKAENMENLHTIYLQWSETRRMLFYAIYSAHRTIQTN